MCKSQKICEKSRNMVSSRPIPDLVFLVVYSIYKRNSWLSIASIEWYTFSRTTSYFLRKWQKSASLQISAI